MRARARALLAAVAAIAALNLALAAGAAQAAPVNALAINTVPATPDLRFELMGRVYTTDKRGYTRIPPADLAGVTPGLLRHRMLLAQHIKLLPNRRPDGSRYQLERWYSAANARNPPLRAALDLYRPVRITLVTRSGRPIDLRVIDAIQMKRIDGQLLKLAPAQLERPVMLATSRVVPLNGELVSKPLLYRIERVSVGGNNLVNRSQQAFLPSKTAEVRLRLLFYSVRFQAKDTLFGFPIGSGIRLVYPNGRVENRPFPGHGEVTLPSLPRGTYHVSVVAPGLSGSTPVSITRDHAAELKVLSYLDIAVLAVLFLALAIGLAVARRPSLRRRLSPRWRLRQMRSLRRSA